MTTMRTRFNERVLPALAGAVMLTLLAGCGRDEASALGPAPAAPERSAPLFPWYRVDPGWPLRPPNVAWGDMPGVAVDGEDRVWLFTRAKPPVQVYDTDGKFLFSWGERIVNRAHHIEIDPEGNVWLADMGDHVIRKCTADGRVLLTLGTPGALGEDESHFDKPTDMAVTATGDVFVSDGYGNNRIVHFDRKGRFVKAWGKKGTAPGEFNLPHAIAADSQGRLYVADRTNARVQVFDGKGTFLAEWRDLIVPWGIWVTPADDIWVCGSSTMPAEGDTVPCCPPKDQLFMRFDRNGKLLQLWTVPKGADGKEQPGELNWVHAMALDSEGNIYAGDIMGKKAQKFVLQR